jgi:hypothetical protein
MHTPTAHQSSEIARHPHQLVGLTVAGLFLFVGIAGFFVTGFSGWTEHDHSQTLLGFAVNPLHNVVHLAIGLAGLALSRTSAGARTFGWLLVVGYGAALVYGLFAHNADWDFLNINAADNWLHLFSVLAGLTVALWPYARDDADLRRTSAARHPEL